MDIFKRPTFTREIAGIGRTPDINLPGAPINLPTDRSGAAPEGGLEFGAPSTIPGQFQQTSRTSTFKGAPPGLAALADFLTAFGGPRGFGSGIPIAAELAQQRNQAPTQFFNQQQQQADIGTQRTLQMHQIQQQEEQMNKPLISINQETGAVTVVHPRKIAAGDIAAGVQRLEPKKMTGEDFHHFIKGLEKDYGVTFSPDELLAISQSVDNPKKLQDVAVKIMQEKQQAARAQSATDAAEQRRAKAEEAATARVLKTIVAADARQNKAIAAADARQEKSLAAAEEARNKPTTTSRATAEFATTLLPHIDEAKQMISDLDKNGKLGPIMGRWNEFMAGTVGSGDEDYATFRMTMNLLKTGLMRIHVGARGGVQLLAKFDKLLAEGKMDKATLNGALNAYESFAKGYAELGQTTEKKNIKATKWNPKTGRYE